MFVQMEIACLGNLTHCDLFQTSHDRAVADQLEGNQEKCRIYRDKAIDYMRANPDLFQPFVDEDYNTVNLFRKQRISCIEF